MYHCTRIPIWSPARPSSRCAEVYNCKGASFGTLSELQKETLCIMKKVGNFLIPLVTGTSVGFEQYQRLEMAGQTYMCDWLQQLNHSTVSETNPRYSSLQPNVENDSWKIETPLYLASRIGSFHQMVCPITASVRLRTTSALPPWPLFWSMQLRYWGWRPVLMFKALRSYGVWNRLASTKYGPFSQNRRSFVSRQLN